MILASAAAERHEPRVIVSRYNNSELIVEKLGKDSLSKAEIVQATNLSYGQVKYALAKLMALPKDLTTGEL